MSQLTPQQISQLYGFRPQPTAEQIKRQNIARVGAGVADVASGFFGQRAAEGQIEELGAEQEALTQQFKDLSAPSLTDANTIAAATRNAAILGGVPQQQDQSAELAAAKMAMESGADPATVQRQLAAAQQAEEAASGALRRQAFQEGLGMAQADARNQFAQQQQGLMMEMDANAQALDAAQRESLMAQQQKSRGFQGLLSGGLGLYSNRPKQPGDNTNTDTINTTDTTSTVDNTDVNNEQNTFLSVTGGLDGDPSTPYAEGGAVQKTPGEYDHDTNDMILMAQDEGGKLVDTGIRQTGGEYVIDPFDAGNMRQAHENTDSVKLEKVRKGQASLDKKLAEDLMRLYDAVRFVKEPQFQDDYEA